MSADPVVVRGGLVAGHDGATRRADVVLAGGLVADVARDVDTTGCRVVDAGGCIVSPGFVDLQCNGAGGIDLSEEPDRLWEVAALLPRWGVTSWQPTIVTSPPDVREAAMAAVGRRRDVGDVPVARPVGLHFEGPFLSPAHRGAHRPAYLTEPSLEVAAGWSRDAGVSMVTLAPELPGALDVVRALVARGVNVAAGHSGATFDEGLAAVAEGVSFVTHLFNAMASLHHRSPGLAGLALIEPRLRFGIIADGVHVDPTVVALAWRAARGRVVLVTDGVAPMGCTDADAVRLADGTLAGATTTMDRAVRNLVAFTGCTLAEAAGAASPGSRLERDAPADVVVLDDGGEVVTTVVGGAVVPPQ
jgi:N-acetylglucosamine-6-phosphate deacetylase